MKTIGIIKRVDLNKNYSEKRDSLDQNWHSFCDKFNFLSLPLPNIKKKINAILVKNGWLEIDTKEYLNLYENLYKKNKLDKFYKICA